MFKSKFLVMVAAAASLSAAAVPNNAQAAHDHAPVGGAADIIPQEQRFGLGLGDTSLTPSQPIFDVQPTITEAKFAPATVDLGPSLLEQAPSLTGGASGPRMPFNMFKDAERDLEPRGDEMGAILEDQELMEEHDNSLGGK